MHNAVLTNISPASHTVFVIYKKGLKVFKKRKGTGFGIIKIEIEKHNLVLGNEK